MSARWGDRVTLLPPPLHANESTPRTETEALSLSAVTARALGDLALKAFDSGDRVLLENALGALVALASPRLPP